LSPATLLEELGRIGADKHYPIYITHTKPAETAEIMSQIGGSVAKHDIRWLEADDILVL